MVYMKKGFLEESEQLSLKVLEALWQTFYDPLASSLLETFSEGRHVFIQEESEILFYSYTSIYNESFFLWHPKIEKDLHVYFDYFSQDKEDFFKNSQKKIFLFLSQSIFLKNILIERGYFQIYRQKKIVFKGKRKIIRKKEGWDIEVISFSLEKGTLCFFFKNVLYAKVSFFKTLNVMHIEYLYSYCVKDYLGYILSWTVSFLREKEVKDFLMVTLKESIFRNFIKDEKSQYEENILLTLGFQKENEYQIWNL